MFPNLFIIGAPRSGSTFLYGYLSKHPSVFMSAQKEPWHFATETSTVWRGPGDDQPITDYKTYMDLFREADPQKHHVIGEASTCYLHSPLAPYRIRNVIPHPRIIAVLRNPVERAWSNYIQHISLGRESENNFLIAVSKEPERSRLQWSPFWQYTGVSKYRIQIERWLDVFPREKMLLVPFDDLAQNPQAVFRDVDAFLGIEHLPDPLDVTHRNEHPVLVNPMIHSVLTSSINAIRPVARGLLPERSRHGLSAWARRMLQRKPTMPPRVRAMLAKGFQEDIEFLEKLLDRDLSHWH